MITLYGNNQYSDSYIITYGLMGLFNLVMSILAIGIGVYRFFGKGDELGENSGQIFFTATSTPEDNNYRLLSRSLPLRLGALAAFTILVIVSLTMGLQIWVTPSPYSTGVIDVDQVEQAWLATIPVAPNEDYTFNFMLTNFFIFVIWAVVYFGSGKRWDIKDHWISFLAVVIIASLLSSTGFTYILPGFSTAHANAYQECQPCFYSAAAFGFVLSVFQQMTGMFFMGIPHAVHNFLIELGFMVVVGLGGAKALVMIHAMRIKKRSVPTRPKTVGGR